MPINIEPVSKGVLEVKTTWNEKEANELLASGKWQLLHGGLAHMDSAGFQAKPCFVLGRME